MTEPDKTNGWTWRVRLGDVLTMATVCVAAIGLMCQALYFFVSSANNSNDQLRAISERVVKIETKIDMMSQKNEKKEP